MGGRSTPAFCKDPPMIRTFQTTADPRDFRAMVRGKGTLRSNLLFVLLPVALAVFGLVYAIWRSPIAASAAAVALFAAGAWSNVCFFSKVNRRRSSAETTTAVDVIEVQASRVLEIEHLGSHGPAWIFFADGAALLLVGQWLLEQKRFPSASFRLHRWSDTKEVIRIEPAGKRLRPEHSNACLRPSYRFTDVEVIQAAPDTLQGDLDRAFDAPRP